MPLERRNEPQMLRQFHKMYSCPGRPWATTILGDTTVELTCNAYTKAEADSRFQAVGDTAALDARYFPINSFTEGGPIFNLIQDQFTPRRIRSLVPRAPVSLLPILGNGSALEMEVDCWSKSESDSRYVLTATFNSLGTQVTALDGRVAALEASPLPADISCFVETPELRNTPIVLRAIDNTPLASFAAAGITLDQDVTVNADHRTLPTSRSTATCAFVRRC